MFPDLISGLIFTALCLTFSVGVIHLSGFIPTDGIAGTSAGIQRNALLFGGALLTACIGAFALIFAVGHIGWAVAVIIAGSTFLLAPFVVSPLPAFIRDGKAGIWLYIAIASATLALAITHT